jgi:hypothetical protein
MPTDPTDADLDSLLCRIDATGAPAGLCPACQRTPPAALARTTANQYRRAWSESKLLEILPYHLAPATTYHILTGGDIDALSFLKHVVRAQPLDYCLLSTWCMALDDVAQLADWLTTGRIKRLDVYVGEIFPGSYAAEHRALVPVIRAHGGRVAVFRNHSKVIAGTGPAYPFAVASSANVNTNPRTENTVLTTGHDVFDFYRTYFDAIRSYSRDFDDWRPWQPPSPPAAG